MRQGLPTPRQERLLTAASRLHVKGDVPWLAERLGGWAAASLIARCAFFVLGAVTAGLTAAVFEFVDRSTATLIAGVALLGAAEWLMRGKRLFHAGVEEALWVGGLLGIADHFMPSGALGVAEVIALVLAVAALRLLNPLLLTLAAMVASIAIDIAGGHHLFSDANPAIASSVFCYSVGAAALLLSGIEFRRPSHDQMLSWLMVFMPLCGFVWLATEHAAAIRAVTTLASLGYGAAALIIGLRRRAHAPLIACLACFGCVAYQLRDLTSLPLEFKLMLWGGVALILALVLDRYLRTPRRGITSHQIGAAGGAMDLVQMFGAAALSPEAAAQTDTPFEGGGGKFGGGGADGSY